jgi:hypothetical protein
MRAKVQICATGNKEGIRSLHTRLNTAGTIRFLKPTVLTPQNDGVLQWCADFQECLTQFPEDEIAELLDKDLLATLKVMRGCIDELMVVLVCEHGTEPDDRPRGYSVSLDLIRMLADVGASLEIDIVRDLISP